MTSKANSHNGPIHCAQDDSIRWVAQHRLLETLQAILAGAAARKPIALLCVKQQLCSPSLCKEALWCIQFVPSSLWLADVRCSSLRQPKSLRSGSAQHARCAEDFHALTGAA